MGRLKAGLSGKTDGRRRSGIRLGKSGLTILTKTMFALFIVLMVFFVFFMVTGGRIETLEKRRQFDIYTNADNVFEAVLSMEDCFSHGEYSYAKWQIPSHGLLSKTKLDIYDGVSMDLPCVTIYDMFYSLHVEDLATGEKWDLGFQDFDMNYSEKALQFQHYVSIFRTTSNINLGKATLIAYSGALPTFYGSLKRQCSLGLTAKHKLTTRHTLSYANGVFCMNAYCFYSDFGCQVNPFTIEPGEYMLYLDYKDDTLNIIK